MNTSFRNRLLAGLICALTVFALSACGGKDSGGEDAGTAVESAAPAQQAGSTADGPELPEEEQRRILEENRELWAFTDPWDSPWFYTFTDLDHNGRLEVIAATTQGSGMYTYAHFWEVLADGSGIDNCYHKGVEVEGPDDWPEIVLESLPCRYDAAEDRWYYPCEGITRSGAAYAYCAWYALCLKDGVADWELLAEKTVETEGGNPRVSCLDAQGNPISEAEYDGAVERRFAGMEASVLKLDWTQVENPFPDTAPEEEASPITITKNPTSEALTIGGRTWFIAHAEGAETLTWQLLDPEGRVYSLEEAMAANPGLSLEALEGDTIAVGKVPLSVNGWGVRARFDGQGSYAVTEPAWLYVGDFAGAYGEVIGKYRTAYQTGNNTGQYAWDNGLSEMIAYSTGVGYALKDLDKNGIPELVIAGMGTDDFSGGMVYDLYTLVDGAPVQLACSHARDRFYLRTDSCVVNEGSGGASSSIFQRLRLNGDQLITEELLFTYPETVAVGNQSVEYYARQGGGDTVPDGSSTKLTEPEFRDRLAQLEGSRYLPPLTKLA